MSAAPILERLLERLLRRDGAIAAVGLFVLCALTWIYIAAGAGLGMSAWDMTRMALLPQQHVAAASMDMGDMTPATWGARYWTLMIAMWWTMMIAMMTPSAAPTILLYARVHRHAAAQEARTDVAPTALFAAGYFLTWLLFSMAAAALQYALQRADVVSAMTMGSQVRWWSGATLLVAGLYQLSPLKNACLSHCRAPAAFLSRHWRPGPVGALRLGMMHGAYCVGCCWMLMALLFVGGVMNLAWIAALSLLVLAEKLLAAGPWVGRCTGVALMLWGVVILAG